MTDFQLGFECESDSLPLCQVKQINGNNLQLQLVCPNGCWIFTNH